MVHMIVILAIDVPAATNISNGFFPMKTYFNELEKLPTVTNVSDE